MLHCLRWPGQLVAARTVLRICGKSLVQRTGAFLSRCHLTIAKIRFSWLYWHLPSYNVIYLPYDPIVSTCHGQELVYALIICYIFYFSCPRVDLGQGPCRIPITFHLFVGCPEKLGRFVFAHGRMRTKSACGCRCHPVQIDFTNEITASTFWSFYSAKKQQYDQFCQGYSPGVNSSYGFFSCKKHCKQDKEFRWCQWPTQEDRNMWLVSCVSWIDLIQIVSLKDLYNQVLDCFVLAVWLPDGSELRPKLSMNSVKSQFGEQPRLSALETGNKASRFSRCWNLTEELMITDVYSIV